MIEELLRYVLPKDLVASLQFGQHTGTGRDLAFVFG